MLDAPRQDWAFYESLSRPIDLAWNRRLSPSQRFALYADLFDVVWKAREISGVGNRSVARYWQEKINTRRRLVAAFDKLDQLRERAAAKNIS